MNILHFLIAIEKPDGFIERGYTEDEIWNMVKGPTDYDTNQLIDKLFYYSKAKMDPTDDVIELKKRFEAECNDTWCMYTVAVPMQKDHYRSCDCKYVLKNALIELDKARRNNLRASDLETLEYWYQKTK